MDPDKPLETTDSRPHLSSLIRALFVAAVSVMASMTVVTHVAQICGVRFSIYAVVGACVSIVAAIAAVWKERAAFKPSLITSQPKVVFVLVVICLLACGLGLFSHRPDMDDAYYLPNVVYFLEHPDEPMDFVLHFIDVGDKPVVAYHRGSIPFEYSQGMIAYLTGLPLLTVYYFVFPVLFCFMVPLAWFYLLTRFSFKPWPAVAGAVFICLFLILLGEQHRSFGNFTFNRIFQGKTVMLAIGINVFAAFSIDFYRSPDIRKWFYLFMASVAMIGLTTSSAILIPLFAVILAVSCCTAFVDRAKSCIGRSLAYFASLVYPVLYALSILLFSLDQLGADSPIHLIKSLDFVSHARQVVEGPVILSTIIVGTLAAVLALRANERKLIIAWIVSVVVLCLNPLTAPFVIKHVTSPDIYWRIFFLYPFPLVVGLSIAALTGRLSGADPKWRWIVLGGGIVLLLLAHLPESSSSVFRHETRFCPPKYRVTSYESGNAVLAVNPPAGTMLAPLNVSLSLPLLTSKYPQMIVRNDGIQTWTVSLGIPEEGTSRIDAWKLLGGMEDKKPLEESLENLVELLHRWPRIRTVVAHRVFFDDPDDRLSNTLLKEGFSDVRLAYNHVVFIRPDSD